MLDHMVRMSFGIASFVVALVIASRVYRTPGSPRIGRALLVLFSFNITTSQVAHYDDPLTWNSWVTGVVVAVSIFYCIKMIDELEERHRG